MTVTYNIYRSESQFTEFELPTPLASGITNKYFSDTTAISGTLYYYRISAVRNGIEKVGDLITANNILRIAPTSIAIHGTTGLTSYGSFNDDNSISLGSGPSFMFKFLNSTYKTNIYVGSNGNVSFGQSLNIYSGFAPQTTTNSILINSQDHGSGLLYAGMRTDMANAYVIRFTSVRLGTEVWELTLFSDGTMALKPITLANTTGKSAISDGINWLAEYSISVNNTYWFYNTGSGYDLVIV